MDNDNFVVQCLRDVVKTASFYSKYAGYGLLNEEAGNAALAAAIESGKPFAALRGGATELRCVAEYRRGGEGTVFSKTARRHIAEMAGVFSSDDESLQRFCNLYQRAMLAADYLAVWDVGAEHAVARGLKKAGHTQFLRLRSLEPYYFENPWSAALAGKKVLVVHPFAATIESQYARREQLFPGTKVLPQFAKLTVIPAVQSIAGQRPAEYATWFEALNAMKEKISAADFDVAVIGAGAYGLPLAAHCKQIGKSAVQTSGSTQLLFGIKGRRWDSHPVISKLYNDAWVRPSSAETPPAKDVVEGGSYW